MRLFKAFLAVVLLSSISFAGPSAVVQSSNTVTADSAYIENSRWFTGVVVSTASAGSTLTIYNSTHTTEGQIAVVDLGTVHSYEFEDVNVKGIFYVKTGVSSVTILYRK